LHHSVSSLLIASVPKHFFYVVNNTEFVFQKQKTHLYPESVQTMELNILERVVAGSEEPSHLDLSHLQSITENFSKQRKIGVGGCGEVYKVTAIFMAAQLHVSTSFHSIN